MKLRASNEGSPCCDGVETLGDAGAGLGDALPALGRGGGRGSRALALRAGQADDVVALAAAGVAVGRPAGRRLAPGKGIEGGLLAAGLLAEHRAQTPDHEDGQREKDEGRDVEGFLHRRSGVGAVRRELPTVRRECGGAKGTTLRIWGCRLVTSTRCRDKESPSRPPLRRFNSVGAVRSSRRAALPLTPIIML